MAVHYTTDNLPTFNNAVVTIGTFDGVHAGHQVILDQVVQQARQQDGTSVLVTFHPHPRKLVFPDQPIHVLTPLEEKISLVTATGIDEVIVVPFTQEFASLSAEEYITDFLVKKIAPKTIIIGYDHHFGNDRKGNIELLNDMKDECGFNVIEIEAQIIDEAAISSTKIRKAIAAGDVLVAREMLNRPYRINGKVVKGNQLGRTIGYPTANITLQDPEQRLPAGGVYAVKAIHDGNTYSGMLNIGYRPTVSEEKLLNTEVHLFDFDKDIYGDNISIDFIERVRHEQKFDGIDQLKQQLDNDKQACLNILS